MADRTATEMSFEERQRRIEEAALHDYAEWFFREYAPAEEREKARFHADLFTMIHRIYAAAQAPLIKQMSAAMALLPSPLLRYPVGESPIAQAPPPRPG